MSRHGMPDWAVVVLAAAVAAGALTARRFPLLVALALLVLALASRVPPMLWLAGALLASSLADRSWSGLDPPVPARLHGAVVTLVTDPRPSSGPGPPLVRADARLGGRRVELRAGGPAPSARLADLLAGERVVVDGHLRPVPSRLRRWLATRHVAARLDVTDVRSVAPGDRLSRWINAARRTFQRGATALPVDHRSLFSGLVLGDDRGQRPEVVHDFRASGLTHLLVVSGGNVAVALALAGPLICRLSLGGRFAVGLGVLGLFGTLTRWEPSVLRAVAMASLALLATVLGRPQPGLRLLALAVTGLLLVDPLLVHSVGFQLSVAASAGILLLARPIAARLPGPRWLGDAIAVTAAAQVGVAPVLLPTFGPIPLASLPANLLAGPVAGAVSLWGMAVGVPAGVTGGPVADLVHLPTRLLVAWVASVARIAAALPFGSIDARHLVLIAAAALTAAVTARRSDRLLRPLANVGLAIALVLPVLTPAHDADGATIVRGAVLWRAGDATILTLTAAADGTAVLDALHERRVRTLRVLVARSRTVGAVAVVRARHDVGLLVDRTNAPDGATTTVGPFSVAFRHTPTGLDVRVERTAYGLPAATQASTAAVGRRPRSPTLPQSDWPFAHARHRARSSVVSWSLAAGARFRPRARAPPRPPPPAPPPAPEGDPPPRIRPSSRPAPLNRAMKPSNSSRWSRHRSSSQRRPSKPNSIVWSAPNSSPSWRSHVKRMDTFFAI